VATRPGNALGRRSKGSRSIVAPRASAPQIDGANAEQAVPVELDVRDELAAARLEDIHTARGDWVQVARLHASRADTLVDPAERAQALCRAAMVCREQLDDLSAARAHLRRAFYACPDEARVADELDATAAESAEAAADVRGLYVSTARECELGAPHLASELWLRVALLDLAARGDAASAMRAMRRVSDPLARRALPLLDRIERQAGAIAVLDELAELCRRVGDLAREKRVVLRSLDLAADKIDRAARHRAIAALAAGEQDQDGARWHAAEALRLDRSIASARVGVDAVDQDRAGAELADRYWRERRWHDLEPLLERLMRPGPSGPVGAEHLPASELYYRAGHVALELGKFEDACRLYRATLGLDQVHLPALGEQALAAAALGQWDEAHELHGAALLVQRSLGRPPVELAETLYRMGEAREKGGQPEAALTLHESALDVHPAHRRALEAACRVRRAAGELRAVDRLLRAALPHAAPRRRVDLLIELAGLASRFFGEPAAAVSLVREALALSPGERRLLLPLVEHCQAAGQWREAIEALAQLAEHEGSALRRGRYYHLAGGLAEHLSVDEAVEYLERALDCYFGPVLQPPGALRDSCLRAFREIEALLAPRGDYKRLERAYRAMIKRLGPDAAELPQLWSELGRIYREHLGQAASAIQSFEVASALEADRLTHHRILIDLYQGAAPDELDKLIERRRRLIAAEPFSAEHYSALRSLFVKSKNRDGTFAACRALVFLDRADRKEDEFYRRHRRDRVIWPERAMGSADWRRLRHPDEDPLVAAVLAMAAEPLALSEATTPRRLRLRDDGSDAYDHVRALYRKSCSSLGVAAPDLFLAPAVEADCVLANLRRGSSLAPAFVIGCRMYESRSSAQMVHTMARALSYARRPAYLRLLLGPSHRVAAAFAAACEVAGGMSDGAPADEVERFTEALERRAGDAWRAELRGAVRRLRDRGGPIDVGRFCQALDATARRAGLLLGGALDVAAADLSREPMFSRRLPREERVADLLVHSVSDEHLGLRRSLGLSVVETMG
jgi:tetratricopeptide (TPR) repeat protein